MIKMQKSFFQALVAGAQSGDTACQFVVNALKGKERHEILKGPANNFRLVVNGDKTPVIRYTPVDPEHPEIKKRIRKDPYYLFDRDAEASPAKFLDLFRDFPAHLRKDGVIMEAFAESLKLGVKIEYTLCSNTEDFLRGYRAGNYWDQRSAGDTLHNSCMRHSMHSQVSSDFYTKIGHAMILLATHEGKTAGRAVVWPDVSFVGADGRKFQGSLLSRVYYTHSAIRQGLFLAAKKLGINFRLAFQTYDCNEVVVLNPSQSEMTSGDQIRLRNARTRIWLHPKYKGGMPYVDVFGSITLHTETDQLYLSMFGTNLVPAVGDSQDTDGAARYASHLCPVCGAIDRECNCLHDEGVAVSYRPLVDVPDYGLVPKACTVQSDLGYELSERAKSSLLLDRLRDYANDDYEDEDNDEDDI